MYNQINLLIRKGLVDDGHKRGSEMKKDMLKIMSITFTFAFVLWFIFFHYVSINDIISSIQQSLLMALIMSTLYVGALLLTDDIN